MTVRVVYGPPASGKSTYVNENRGPLDIVIDQDALCVALGSPDPHDHPDSHKRVAGAARAMAIRKAIDLGYPVWVIDSWLRTPSLREYPDCQYILVDPGQAITLRRAERSGRPQEAIDAIHRWYLNPPQPPHSAVSAPAREDAVNLGGAVADWW